MDKMYETGNEFEAIATKVSDAIKRELDYINTLPGKVEVSANDGTGLFWISLKRSSHSSEWSLFTVVNEEERRLDTAPVDVKAMGLILIPKLLENLAERQAQITRLCKESLSLYLARQQRR